MIARNLAQEASLHAGSLFDYLEGFRATYPDIRHWAAKIVSQACSGKRSLFSVVDQGRVLGLAITKNTSFAKLCHFSVMPSHRDLRLGEQLLRAAATDMLAFGAVRVHVTTSEEVAGNSGGFFARYGFTVESWDRGRYNRGTDELVWVVSRSVLADRILAETDTSDLIRRLLPAVRRQGSTSGGHSRFLASDGEVLRRVRLEQQPVRRMSAQLRLTPFGTLPRGTSL